MPYSRTLRPGVACLVISAMLLIPGGAAAATTIAHLRVVNAAGTSLADQSQVTGDVTIKTDPGADCFGSGNGGSGNDVPVPGPTALGIVKDGSETIGGLRPLSVTDAFYPGFGLGLCGVGGFAFHPGDTGFWYFKVNHAGAQVSGSQYTINAGDEVLWYQAPGFPPPSELQLDVPTTAKSGKPFTARVFAYSDSGARSAVAGALVTGADQPTTSDGTTTVVLTRTLKLQALHGADIPSNEAIVACLPSSQSPCGLASKVARHRIIGTNRADWIRATKMPDLVRARAGDDHVNARGGLGDIVNCGRGRDKAIVDDADVTRRCEKVIRKR